jgi:serine/threonine-protein kinase
MHSRSLTWGSVSAPSSLIGATLGAYELQALLGSGGMATVYRGFDRNLHRAVAVKVLSPTLAADPAFVDRFRQEARLIANLHHPHIAQVFAFGEHAGAPYMVQELLPGPTLEQRLKDLAARGEGMPQHEVIATLTQLAGALDAAHAVGIIHRDVKPSNALYNAQGQIVLTDFGIARGTADVSRAATAAGVVMGTPGYVAPEQAISSASLTPACDIYALGVVAFELLCGRLPFDADTAMGIVLKHLYDPPPPPTSVRPDLPAALDAVVLKALEKEPTARFRSAGEFAQALAAAWPLAASPLPAPADIHSQPTRVWAGAPASAAPPARVSIPPGAAPARPAVAAAPSGKPRLLLPLLGLVLLGVFIGGAVLALRGGTSPETATPSSAAPTSAAIAAAATAAAPASDAPAPTVPTIAPTSAPAPATAVPAKPTNVPLPTSAPAATIEPVANLQSLLINGIAAGQVAKKDGQDMLKKLDEVAKALNKGDQEKASNQLRDLLQKVREKARENKMDATLAEQALAGIDQIASTYGLSG